MSDPQMTTPDGEGRHWVYVSRAQAQGHPKGRPGLALHLIALWFVSVGAFELVLAVTFGLPLWSLALSLLTCFTALGLILRIPWVYLLAVILPVRQLFGFLELVGGGAVGMQPLEAIYAVANAMIAMGVIFHMLEGDRPNLIYRFRYRSYRAEREGG